MVRLRLAYNRGSGSFAFVAAESKSRRDGKRCAKLGDYNPMLPVENPNRLRMDLDAVLKWIGNGAQPSERAARLIKQYSAKEGKTLPENVVSLLEKCMVMKPAKQVAA